MSMSKAKFLCHQCKKSRPMVPQAPNSNICLRCKLYLNKILLLKYFDSIVGVKDMKSFQGEMETWYLNDA